MGKLVPIFSPIGVRLSSKPRNLGQVAIPSPGNRVLKTQH